MNCPSCTAELKPMERQNVEIDYCPKCRGVWLDRGELDKIVQRSAAGAADRRAELDDDDDERGGRGGRRGRGRSWLGDIFDLGD